MRFRHWLGLALALGMMSCATTLWADEAAPPKPVDKPAASGAAAAKPADKPAAGSPTTAKPGDKPADKPADKPVADPMSSSVVVTNLNDGDKAMGKKDYATALSKFIIAWMETPDNPAVLTRIGDVFFETKKYPEASRFYALAIKLNDGYDKPLLNLARTYMQVNRADQVVMLLEDAKRQQTFANSFRYFHLLGLGYTNMKQYDKAIPALQNAIKLSPESPFLYGDLGNAQYLSNHYEEAVQSYSKAVEKNPNDFMAMLNRSVALEKLNRLPEAIASLQSFLTLSKAADDNPQRKRLEELKAKAANPPEKGTDDAKKSDGKK